MRSTIAAVAGIGIGIWMMFAPAVFGYDGGAATVDRVIGPTAAAAAWIAASGVTRSVRWVNVAAGVCALLSLLFLQHTTAAVAHRILSGVGIIVTALAMGPAAMSDYGGGWKVLIGRREGG